MLKSQSKSASAPPIPQIIIMGRMNGDSAEKRQTVREQSVFGVKITGAIYIYG